LSADTHDDTEKPGRKCLPTYLVLDISSSMQPHEQLLNQTLVNLFDTLQANPRVSEFAHLSIIAFSTTPHLVLEMTDIDKVDTLPQVACNGATNYGAAFGMVQDRINADLPDLRAAGLSTLRPIVFFMTDGEPTDHDWEKAFELLVDKSWPRHPHVVTYGFGQATPEVLKKVATKAAFIANEFSADQDALASALSSLVNTIVKSAERQQTEIPEEVPGYTSIPIPDEEVT